MLSDLLYRPPLNLAGDQAREETEFNATATILSEVAYNNEEDGDSITTLVPIGGLKNIRCRVYPIESRDRVPTFETSRMYTDKILLDGFYPRINNGQYARVTRASGEQVVYEIVDTSKDGNDERTTLLSKARFDKA